MPLMFNGMFLVRQRRLYCFGTDVTTGSEGKRIRGNAKMMVRVNTIIVSLYLWESLVLQTSAVQGMCAGPRLGLMYLENVGWSNMV